jgi:hypothetical protein
MMILSLRPLGFGVALAGPPRMWIGGIETPISDGFLAI